MRLFVPHLAFHAALLFLATNCKVSPVDQGTSLPSSKTTRGHTRTKLLRQYLELILLLGGRGFLSDLLQRLKQGLQNLMAAPRPSQTPADYHPGFDFWGRPFTPTPSPTPADLGWSPSPSPSNKPSNTPADYHPGYDPWGRPFTPTPSSKSKDKRRLRSRSTKKHS